MDKSSDDEKKVSCNADKLEAAMWVEYNKLIGELEPRRDYYNISQQRMTIPDVYSTLEGDLYVLLIDWKPVGPQQATFKVYLNPLINWIWIGGFLFILGTLVATWPDQRDRHIITNNKSIVQPF